MNFITKMLTPVFIALGLVNPVIETPAPETPLQQEVIELRKKVQELEKQEVVETGQEVEDKIVKIKPVEVIRETVKLVAPPVIKTEVVTKPDFVVEEKKQILDSVKFEFKNIKTNTKKTEATIRWETTEPSESRLVVHRENLIKNIFPSNTGKGSSHSVTITGLNSSSDYTYELIAKNDDKEEISSFHTFYTEREYVVGTKYEDECLVIVVEDTIGKPLVGGKYTLHAWGTNQMYPRLNFTTDKDGEFEYCKEVSSLRIVNSNNEEVYP